MASFYDFAIVCQALGQTGSRLQIADLAAEFLARLSVDEAEIAARFMVGRALAQGEEKRLHVSGGAIWRIAVAMVVDLNQLEDPGEEIFATAIDFGEAVETLLRRRADDPEPTLTIAHVARRFAEIAAIEGRNSRRRKFDILRGLFECASAIEGKYLAKILIGEMRHGMSEGLMLEAIARMAGRPATEVRRAHMLEGDLGRVVRLLRAPEARAAAASTTATPAEEGTDASVFADASVPSLTSHQASAGISASTDMPADARAKPLRPMLATPAPNIAEAFRILDGRLALEHKLDGARVQIHCGSEVRIFSRRLNEVTPSLPEVVEMMAALGSRHAIFDGEAVAVDADGRSLAFQELMRRFGRLRDIARLRVEQPIRLFLFDLMSLDGELLIDSAYERRYALLHDITTGNGLELATRIVPESLAEAQEFYARAIADGYEGVMAKALGSSYTPGARGRGWLKIKTARTFDLVIVAADWGYGRRHGWLSNYHLAVRDERTDGLIEVGKTFKGLTDADFEAMTERLLALKTDEARGTVFVRPEVVVEVAYSDIQRSPQYAGGMALRFARIVGVRSDKGTSEADTIATVTAEFNRQLVKPVSNRK